MTENEKAIKELHEFLAAELEKAEISHQETLARHNEIMKLIDKVTKKD